MSYDRAITVFSPDGHLFQVEYALEAVRRGAVALAVCGKDQIVFGIEKKNVAHLQDPRTIRKIVEIDNHITLAFAGLTADSRILIDRARVEAQSYTFNYEERCPVEHVARFTAQTQQKFTQRGGRRPFGLSTLIAGFDDDGTPRLFQTDPSGVYSEWKACSVGRSAGPINRYLERLYFNEEAPLADPDGQIPVSDGRSRTNVASDEEMAEAQANVDPLRVVVQTLLDVVERGVQSMDVLVMKRGQKPVYVPTSQLETISQQIAEHNAELARLGRAIEPITLDAEI